MRRNLTTRRVKLKKLRHRLVLILCLLLSACWMQRFLIGCMTILRATGGYSNQQNIHHLSFINGSFFQGFRRCLFSVVRISNMKQVKIEDPALIFSLSVVVEDSNRKI